jgi:hypothetical protein
MKLVRDGKIDETHPLDPVLPMGSARPRLSSSGAVP